MPRLTRTFAALTLAIAAAPALANGGTAEVPEASALTLFALGVLGIIVGRRGAMRGKDRDQD